MIGEVLDGKYRVLEQIGEGGMGAVFAAETVAGGAPVAIKVIIAEDLQKKAAHVRRFHREARAAGTIETPHIARVTDTGTDAGGRPYMVMELMRGRDLGELLRRESVLRPEIAVAIAAQACRGLAAAHAVGVIHRDIKPANVFLDERGGTVTVKLCDFGIAKLENDMLKSFHESTLTKDGGLLGSPHYMSPEQARGGRNLDHRGDVWSLGVVLYRMLAGRTPFQEVKAFGDLIITLCGTPAPPLQDAAPWVAAPIAAVVHKALRLRPDERFQSAQEMADALTALVPSTHLTPASLTAVTDSVKAAVQSRAELAGEEPAVLSKTETSLAAAPTRTHTEKSRALVLVALGAGLALGAVAVYGWLGTGDPGEPRASAAPSPPDPSMTAPTTRPSVSASATATHAAASAAPSPSGATSPPAPTP